MPIRSDRGRNATLRNLATWPLHSPRRLAGTCTALALLCAGVTFAVTATSSPSNTAPANPAPSVMPRVTVLTVARSSAPTTNSSRPVVVGDPAAVSLRFAEGWVAKLDSNMWRERLAPLCTNEFRTTALPVTSPEQITASTITGAAVLVSTTGRSAATTVALNTMVLALTLHDITGNGDWRIADIQQGR